METSMLRTKPTLVHVLAITLAACAASAPAEDLSDDAGVEGVAPAVAAGAGGGASGKNGGGGGASGKSGGTGGADAGAPVATGGSAGTGGTGGGGGGVGGGGGTGPGGVRWLGRVDASDANAPKFTWSATGLVATVSGTKISVRLQSEGSASFYQPVIDATPGKRFQVASGATQTVVLADSLAAGDHTVELYRESEGMYGDTVFLGFADGTVKGAPPASGRLIEVVGDSISAGYGNLGNEVHPPWDNTCSFSLDTQSAYMAYGAIAARALNAEVSIIAVSGQGMYRSLGGDPGPGTLPTVYDHTLGTGSGPTWSFERKASAVVINLGTNDWGKGDPGTPFEDTYVQFIHTLRGHYPDAWIFLTIGTMTADPGFTQAKTRLANVVGKAGDAKVSTFDLGVQNATSTGCDYHPNVAEDQRMANIVVAALKAKLGW
jgi:hypothetical protein